MSRTSQRSDTKSKMHKACQGRTQGARQRAMAPHKGTARRKWLRNLPAEAVAAILNVAEIYGNTGEMRIEINP